MPIHSEKTSTTAWRTWVFNNIGGGGSLTSLSDVDTAAQTAGFGLMSDGANYYGRALVEADITDLGTYLTDITGEALSTLSDVTITGIASGEVLKWNGSAWINNTLAELGVDPAGTDNSDDNAVNTLYSGLVTNATHTGDVTGSTALTIAAGAVDIAMLANGTDGELITWSAAAAPATVAVGTAGQVLTSGGVGVAPTFQTAASGGITLGTAQASTSGTIITFTGIPAGTKRIKVMFDGVSGSGSKPMIIQIGDAGGFETSGYLSTAMAGTGSASDTTGFLIQRTTTSSRVMHGTITLDLLDAATFSWVSAGTLAETSSDVQSSAGSKKLTAELTQIRITSQPTAVTFDAGVINISYE